GTKKAQILINPALSLSIAERRKSVFTFEIAGKKESYTGGYKYAYFSSWGAGIETGVYFPIQRTGFILGYEKRFFRRISIPEAVHFKEV
ncbi:hypothetical protein, partial [Escherichia coli]|uniref:hypothetical protein n=1 Tax=Escherichia coli TaxID=562 RepID=UPI0014121DDE